MSILQRGDRRFYYRSPQGEKRRVRYYRDTPILDGNPNTGHWYEQPEPLLETNTLYFLDQPPIGVFVRVGGLDLVRVGGSDQFVTWLAVLDGNDGTIYELNSFKWRVSWDSQIWYDASGGVRVAADGRSDVLRQQAPRLEDVVAALDPDKKANAPDAFTEEWDEWDPKNP